MYQEGTDITATARQKVNYSSHIPPRSWKRCVHQIATQTLHLTLHGMVRQTRLVGN